MIVRNIKQWNENSKKSQKGILGMNKIMSALKHPSQVTGTPKAECELQHIPEGEVIERARLFVGPRSPVEADEFNRKVDTYNGLLKKVRE